MTLQLIASDFPYMRGQFSFLFISAKEKWWTQLFRTDINGTLCLLVYSHFTVGPLSCSKYPRWRKTRSRRLHISVQKPAVERDEGGRSYASSAHHHPISQLIRGFFIWRRRNCHSPPRSFLHALSSCIGLHQCTDNVDSRRMHSWLKTPRRRMHLQIIICLCNFISWWIRERECCWRELYYVWQWSWLPLCTLPTKKSVCIN